MEFKIDTKPTYTILTPVSERLDANLTEAIRQKWEELTQSGSQNLIIDMECCNTTDENGMEDLKNLHESFYSEGQSLVFTKIPENVLASLREAEISEVINITPTVIEAIDIVSMEILERDLFSDES